MSGREHGGGLPEDFGEEWMPWEADADAEHNVGRAFEQAHARVQDFLREAENRYGAQGDDEWHQAFFRGPVEGQDVRLLLIGYGPLESRTFRVIVNREEYNNLTADVTIRSWELVLADERPAARLRRGKSVHNLIDREWRMLTTDCVRIARKADGIKIVRQPRVAPLELLPGRQMLKQEMSMVTEEIAALQGLFVAVNPAYYEPGVRTHNM